MLKNYLNKNNYLIKVTKLNKIIYYIKKDQKFIKK